MPRRFQVVRVQGTETVDLVAFVGAYLRVLRSLGMAPSPPEPPVARVPTRPYADLYFFRNPATGLVKIGISYAVEIRRAKLEQQAGARFDVLGVLTGAGDYERPLHRAFAADRVTGEWFRPSPLLVAVAAGDVSPEDCVGRGARGEEL